jgi:hypothetical protein
MQDTVDTLRKQEDGFSTGLAYEKLLNASGKEDLGDGVAVGITVALQNTHIAFEARRTPAESGTVTTGSSAPVNIQIGQIIDFEDAAADFITANVQPGSLVINFSDRSIADVYRVESATKLTTKNLVNGTTNTFQVGDIYQVFNIIQCDLSGGNIVAVDELDTIISPVLPTAFTQVIRSASSSATLISGGLPEQQNIRDAMQLAPTGVTQPDSIDGKLDGIPADVVAAINASLHDGRTFTDILQDLLSMASGRIEENPDGTFTFYERDNTTPRFVLTKAGNERTRA